MIDIHNHILFGVDDGANDLESSVKMAEIAYNDGIKAIVATPHFIEGANSKSTSYNKKVLDILNNELEKNDINIKVYLGNEVFISNDIVNMLERDEIATLNNSRYLLIELPMLDIPINTLNIIYNLRLRGIIPIIAHPERNKKIIDDPNILYEFITKGALAQMNINSIVGKYGELVQKTSEILLLNNMIHFIATDAHSFDARTPRIKRKLNYLKSIISNEKIIELTEINSLKVIENEEILIDEPIKYIKKGKFRKIISSLLSMKTST